MTSRPEWPLHTIRLAFIFFFGLMGVTRSSAVEDPVDQLGELKIRFEYGGAAFAPEPIRVAPGRGRNVALVNESLLIHPQNKGIKNVIVYVYTGRRAPQLLAMPPSNTTLTLDCRNSRFDPRILITQTGDTLRVTNSDVFGHNANLHFFNNQARSITLRANQAGLIPLGKSEPAPIPVDSNILPWMRSYVVVLDHPFAAVSDANGELSINGLPVGESLVFRAFHEAGRIDRVEINGVETRWKSSRFDVAISPGVNNMGTVVIPAESLRVQ